MRLRLTLAYGGVFLMSGVVLLAITYFLVRQDMSSTFFTSSKNGAAAVIDLNPLTPASVGSVPVPTRNVRVLLRTGFSSSVQSTGTYHASSKSAGAVKQGGTSRYVQVPIPSDANGPVPTPKEARAQLTILLSEARAQQKTELHQLLIDSGIALLIMAALSILLGWLLAGRALRPLRVIASKAQAISATNLHERIALQGPDDEMKRLGDTFDELLARLERAFGAQRQFVANASHELRTPLARQRALLEVASGDPDADVASLREASVKAVAAGEEQERLIEALLTLASSERGLDDRHPFDLADVAGRVVEHRRPDATRRGLDVETDLLPAPASGNQRLVERLVANLVDNALRYNEPLGWVAVTTALDNGRAVVCVTNSGPSVPQAELERLFEPFQRLTSDRITQEGKGHGLGLSIVRAVAIAHGATVTAACRPTGGLDVRVAFLAGTARRAEGSGVRVPEGSTARAPTEDSS